jgi:cell wall-associated NlpC family hydrolase
MAGRHRVRRAGPLFRFAQSAAVALFSFGLGAAVAAPYQPVPVAHAALAASTESLGGRILDKAETRTGDWYFYGAAGPSAFDCSGLVYWAAGRLGLRNFPRDTYGLIAAVFSGRLSYTSHPQRGDLAFFGTGHVEFVTVWYHDTFGAAHSGTRVGWHRYYPPGWAPTFYLHVNWLASCR